MNLEEKENDRQSDAYFQDPEKSQYREDDLDNSVANEEKENYNNPHRDDNLDDNLERDLDKDLDNELDKELEDMEKKHGTANLDNENTNSQNTVSRDSLEDMDQDLEEIDPVNHPRQF